MFLKSSKDKIAKLPDFSKWSSHKLACLQFTLVGLLKDETSPISLFQGTTGAPKLIALSHYQMLNGARAVAAAFGINDKVIVGSDVVLERNKIYMFPARACLCSPNIPNRHLQFDLSVSIPH